MDEENKIVGRETSGPEVAKKTRRDFAKTAAQVAVTAPAVALLLGVTPAFACNPPYSFDGCVHILDDFTFGNDKEDIDAIALGSNFNPETGKPQQDDHVNVS